MLPKKIFCLPFILASLIIGCSKEPQPINYGHEQCSFCKMTVADPRYGAELISATGKIYKFDSIECLISFGASGAVAENKIFKSLVTDFANPQTFVDAKTAIYLISPNLPSPMGANLTGFQQQNDAVKIQSENGGNIFSWNEVKNLLSPKN